MRALGLLYHDLVERGDFAASGFPGADADRYKLEVGEFKKHLRAIDHTSSRKPGSYRDLLRAAAANEPLLMLTFDDGGVSAYTHTAALLEERGWRGHFFVTTGRIGAPSFLTPDQIRSLHQRGHIIGSHSHSHPARISTCSWKELLREWETSRSALSELLREDVTTASVPGGYLSRRVAEAASNAGFRVLFTSEPITRCGQIDECLIVGRYCLQRDSSAQTASQIARGDWPPRARSWLSWNAKKVAKKVGGNLYIKARLAVLR
ncbi:MAG TPA: polysaccharide deacetylase family protein [Gemmatimonadaceae bacterium]|nr:polysaccharide deacetylase family protein [Gemmatimonadaceae bacterium]